MRRAQLPRRGVGLTEIKCVKTIITTPGAGVDCREQRIKHGRSVRAHVNRWPAARERAIPEREQLNRMACGHLVQHGPGNPINPQTDLPGVVPLASLGAWDSRNDCQ